MGIKNTITEGYKYFVTLTVTDWVRVFTRPRYRHIIVNNPVEAEIADHPEERRITPPAGGVTCDRRGDHEKPANYMHTISKHVTIEYKKTKTFSLLKIFTL